MFRPTSALWEGRRLKNLGQDARRGRSVKVVRGVGRRATCLSLHVALLAAVLFLVPVGGPLVGSSPSTAVASVDGAHASQGSGRTPTSGSTAAPHAPGPVGTPAPSALTFHRDGPRVPPRTVINGSVHINGSLSASTTYLDGDVNILGSAVADDLTQSQGWADYGPTTVTGEMEILGSAGSSSAIFTSNPGSSLWLSPSPANVSALNVLEGNIQFGDAGTGDAFAMSTTGVNITIDAGQAGGFYSLGSGNANIGVANYTVMRNYANSSGPVSIDACVLGVCLTTTVAVGAVFQLASLDCVPILGCIVGAVPTESITWGAGDHFTILGQTNTTGSGMTALLPDSRMDIQVPEGSAVNLSMTPVSGTPTISVAPSAHFPGEVLSVGRVDMSRGEVLQGNVTVLGTFVAGDLAANAGTFSNSGGMTITGEIDSAGYQVFNHKLVIGPQVSIDLFPGSTLDTGPVSIDQGVEINGTSIASGTVQIAGSMIQNASVLHIQGNLSVNGTLAASGIVETAGTTSFSGEVSSAGDISMPHAFLDGSFTLADGSFEGLGHTLLNGTSVAHGWTWVNATTYSVTGDSWLNGTVSVNRSITVEGAVEIQTAPGGAFHLNSTVLMGTTGPGAPWTSRVQGSVLLVGASFANGTSTFGEDQVTFPPGVKVVGSVEAQGNVSVNGTTFFSGAVTSTGNAQFPGMSLDGSFGLSSVGGSVNGTGSSGIVGNVSLVGVLTVDHGVFSEVGSSDLLGALTMQGTVLVTGDSSLSTAPDTQLGLVGNIDLAGDAHIVGNVNTTGSVTIEGSAFLSSAHVNISGTLDASGAVYSRGLVELQGRADFDGPVDTLGRTTLPGITVAGNYTLTSGTFVLVGGIQLTGYTLSTGSIVANSTGYYVTGSSRIVGATVASGSADVVGTSLTIGYVDLDAGATLGTYMVVNGSMTSGGLTLGGPIVLPDDTVDFLQGANISGSIWQSGTLATSGSGFSFVGTSFVQGSVVSPGLPDVHGPLVLPVLGAPFALDLSADFFAFLAGLLLALLVAGVEVLRLTWKGGKGELGSEAGKGRWKALLVRASPFALLGTGAVVGIVGGFSLAHSLTPSSGPSATTSVEVLYGLSAALLLAGAVIWFLPLALRPFRHRSSPPSPGGSPSPPAWAAHAETPDEPERADGPAEDGPGPGD